MICNTVKLIDNISFQSFSGDVRRSCHHDSANLSKMLIFTSCDVNATLRSTKHGITFVKYYKVFKWVFFFSPLIDYVCQDRTHACLFINWLLSAGLQRTLTQLHPCLDIVVATIVSQI